MSSDEETAVVACVAAVSATQVDKRSGREWEGTVTKERKKQGAYYTIVPKLIIDSESQILMICLITGLVRLGTILG